MKYRSWMRVKDVEVRAFDEKAFRRPALATWDTIWHGLSAQARYFFLNVVKGPVKNPAYSNPTSASADRFPARVLEELTAAGFVEVQSATSGAAAAERVIACQAAFDFAVRVRSLARLHLLAADRPTEFTKYVDNAFFTTQLMGVIAGVLRARQDRRSTSRSGHSSTVRDAPSLAGMGCQVAQRPRGGTGSPRYQGGRRPGPVGRSASAGLSGVIPALSIPLSASWSLIWHWSRTCRPKLGN